MPRLREVPRNAWIALAVIFVLGAGIRAQQALNPVARVSADAQSYTTIGHTIANAQRYEGRAGETSALHWPPGTPLLFAAAYRLAPGDHAITDYNPVYWAQWLVSTATILSVFLLAWLLAGAWPGVIAAGLVAFYPPLFWGPSNLLSEPLGAFLVTTAFAALLAAFRLRKPWWYAVAGALFGLVLLTRSDLLPVPFVLALLVLVWLWRNESWRRSVAQTALLLGAMVVVIAPWSIYATHTAHRFVPLTTGGGSALFVGTYLPGNGNTVDLKEHLRSEVVKKHPRFKNTPSRDIPAAIYLDDVAARYPDLDRDSALSKAAQANLKNAVLHHPIDFAGLMLDKFGKLWLRSSLGGAHIPNHPMRVYHFILVIVAALGLVIGLIRRRDIGLGAILLALAAATAVHLLTVGHGRYNLPLMSLLISGGVAGWAFLLEDRRLSRASADPPAAPDPGAGGRDQSPQPTPPATAEPEPA